MPSFDFTTVPDQAPEKQAAQVDWKVVLSIGAIHPFFRCTPGTIDHTAATSRILWLLLFDSIDV